MLKDGCNAHVVCHLQRAAGRLAVHQPPCKTGAFVRQGFQAQQRAVLIVLGAICAAVHAGAAHLARAVAAERDGQAVERRNRHIVIQHGADGGVQVDVQAFILRQGQVSADLLPVAGPPAPCSDFTLVLG